jgi:hypothetical protein
LVNGFEIVHIVRNDVRVEQIHDQPAGFRNSLKRVFAS